MVETSIQRLNYYQFQYIGAEDFRDQQTYLRNMRRRHNIGPHSWGIVSGAEIRQVARDGDAPFVDIQVMPGVVVDGFGREIVILEPTKVDVELFQAYTSDRHLELWIQYDEIATRTATGGFAPCTDAEAYARIIETFRFVVGTPVAPAGEDPTHSPVMVDGTAAVPKATAAPTEPILPDDQSVAYQEFPDNERATRWLVQLGWVHWDGTVGKFRPVASPDKLIQGRHYAGFIGASLLAEGPALRVAPRVAQTDPDAQDFATIEGRLAVEGRIVAEKNVELWGSRLHLLAAGGSDETRALWMQRLGAASGSGTDLRIHIGDTPDAKTRLTIGPGPSPTTAATEKVVFAVTGDDTAQIPTGRLTFGNGARVLIDLGPDAGVQAGQNAIGRHSGSVYYRSQGSHFWHFQGVHDNGDGNPGAGGVQQLELTANGTLAFHDHYRAMLAGDVAGHGFAVGMQDRVLYQRTPQYFAWYRGGGHQNGMLDPGGGTVAMTLDDSNRLAVQGGVTAKGDVQLWGTSLRFLMGDGSEDTDPLEIARVHNSPDRNDLRVTIGDNASADDRFVVGPRLSGGQDRDFIVENSGNVRVWGDLYVQNRKALIDVVAGEILLNRIGSGTGTQPILVKTRMQSWSDLQFIVALSDVGNINVANDARWRVSAAGHSRVDAQTAQLNVDWRVGDSDGELFSFSYLVIFLP